MARNDVASVRLTEMQAAFVSAYFDSSDATKAARSAGYEQSTAHVAAYRLLRTPHVLAAIQAETERRMRTEAAPVAYRVLLDIVRNTAVRPEVRVSAAKTLLDRAGHIAPSPAKADKDGVDKPDNEKTADELRAEIQALERALSDRAKPVDSPTGEQEEPQAIDMLS